MGDEPVRGERGDATQIAHDLANQIQVLYGLAHGLETRLGADPRLRQEIDQLLKVVGETRQLALRLLAAEPRRQWRAVDASQLLLEFVENLRPTLAPTVAVDIERVDGLSPLRIDPEELRNMLLELCLNARDAMPDGGRLRLSVRPCRQRVTGRPMLEIRISDDGLGMSEEVKARAFEPRFSTKADGHSRGFGLGTVRERVQRLGGSIEIRSELGSGSTVSIRLLAAHLRHPHH